MKSRLARPSVNDIKYMGRYGDYYHDLAQWRKQQKEEGFLIEPPVPRDGPLPPNTELPEGLE